ncbi:glycosyl hydrolase [Paenibacillus hodogayensis]|uniref:Glycosyl hydrolase n=1 Tax=Paenibacillus hodogayensis TaxID=279208 RepID=A0ABV5W4B4_9BACL
MNAMESRMFADPPAAYRTAPLWVWNDDMNAERIRLQLGELKRAGFGGAFVHPRPGLITPYLSAEWFALWAEALDEAERLDLKLYIYDENSYPSGFAGGHVPSELPDCLANAVMMRELEHGELASVLPVASGMLNRPGHPIRVFAIEHTSETVGEKPVVRDVTSLPFAEWASCGQRFLVFTLGTPETNSWLGGFAYTDLLRPEVTRLFLHNTYEAYRERFGDKFGERIPAIFTDEPEISPGNLFQQKGSHFLPFSYWFAGQFEERNGYDLKDYLPCLFMDATTGASGRDPRKVRYDYYDTIRELWVQNFVRPVSEWCEANRIAWTGHYLEHNWPYPWGRTSPSVMSLYEYMQWPAIDMLRTNLLIQEGQEGMEPLMLTIREAHSAANQFDRERVLCEAYGAGGWDSDFKDYKRIGDWLFVHGINFLNQHLTFSTIVGARKRDHPQSFDWRQSWWEEYGGMNGYFGRLSYALSRGQTRNRILLLNPCASGYLETPGAQNGGLAQRGNPPQHPDMRLYLQTVQRLCDRQRNYDFGDESIMERHGRADAGRLAVGARSYDVVIYPDSMATMKASTLKLLERYLQSGGTVLAMGEPSGRIDGEASPEAARLSAYASWIRVDGIDDLLSHLDRLLPADIAWTEPERIPEGVHHLRRIMPDGSSLYFIANSSPQAVSSTLTIEAGHVETLCPWAGTIEPAAYRRRKGGRVELDVELPREGSLLLRVCGAERADGVDPDEAEPPLGAAVVRKTQVPLVHGETAAMLEKDNTLVLDYCDLRVGSKQFAGINVIYAQKYVYEAHGFDMNPWDNGVQFKRRLLDRNAFSPQSGFEASFRFRVGPGGRPDRLLLWVERAFSYELKVNGRQVSWSEERSELDHHLQAADLAAFVVEGDNVIELKASPFDIHLELEPVMLTGAFSVGEAEGQWMIGKPSPLTVGSWKKQGFPFYGHGALYENQVRIDDLSKRYTVRLPGWSGTVASLRVNGVAVGLFGAGQGEELDMTSALTEGANTIQVRVSGSFKNVFGPFHDPNRPRKTAWPANWKRSPLYGPPPASEYDLLDSGLLEPFVVEAWQSS